MVIFGAGASYDSSQRHPPQPIPENRVLTSVRFPQEEPERTRPPLTNGLFRRYEFNEFTREIYKLEGVAGILQDLPKGSLEAELQALDAAAARNPIRAQQLAAFRHYLVLLLSIIPHRWLQAIGRASNYIALLEQIRDYDSEPVCLVTFNYDLLLEKALGWEVQDFDGYVQKEWKLIKVHGSVNWARQIKTPKIDHQKYSHVDTMRRIIDAASELEFGDGHTIISSISRDPEYLLQIPVGKPERPENLPLFPAIAIPLPGKLGPECPGPLMAELMRFIPNVDKLLIIGWAGSEAHFLQILCDSGLRPGIPGIVVSGSENSARAAIGNIKRGGVNVDRLQHSSRGFIDFVTQGELRLLYQNSGTKE